MVSKVWSRSHGHPPGARRRAMISTSRAKPAAGDTSGSEGGMGIFRLACEVRGEYVMRGVALRAPSRWAPAAPGQAVPGLLRPGPSRLKPLRNYFKRTAAGPSARESDVRVPERFRATR